MPTIDKTLVSLSYICYLLVVIVLGLEVGIFSLAKLGTLELTTKTDIENIANTPKDAPLKQTTIYTPHPYFGYVYTPNNQFFQKTYMESNSDGFIDAEFPVKKRGVCIYGLLGGSGAMSWGVEKDHDRISHKLESLLNENSVNSECTKYHVLNMGIGSQHQYQATQIFLFYQNLLDGVIFYVGNNECSHGSVFATDKPAQFPEFDLFSLLQINSPTKLLIAQLRHEQAAMAHFLLDYQYLLSSNILNLLYTRFFKDRFESIDHLNNALVQETALGNLITGKKRHSRQLFKNASLEEFWYSDKPVFQQAVIKEILPLVFSQPLITAYIVAQQKQIHFLSVIQPMSTAFNRPQHWLSPHAITPYQRVCNRIFLNEAEQLRARGITLYNLNNPDLFSHAAEDVFSDNTHLTPTGNTIVARNLYDFIQKEWHSN